jgi:hypothetical protein
MQISGQGRLRNHPASRFEQPAQLFLVGDLVRSNQL